MSLGNLDHVEFPLEVGFAVEICGLVFAERKAFLKNRSYRTELHDPE